MDWRRLFGLKPVPGNLVTYRDLKLLYACEEQLRLFRRLFGRKVLITESVAREFGWRFDVTWATYKLLTRVGRAAYIDWEAEAYSRSMTKKEWAATRWVKMAELLVTHRSWKGLCDE
jgi:hypothetical protein